MSRGETKLGVTQSYLDAIVRDFGGPAAISDIYPLTPAQHGLLYEAAFEDERPLYVTTISWTVRGELDLAAYEAAWSHVIARHDTLRTAIVGFDLERPLQIVLSQVDAPMALDDLSELRGAELDAALEALAAEERQRPFDLASPPLARLRVARLSASECRVIWTNHHAILDGWSMPVLMREMAAAYEAEIAGVRAALPPPGRYRDHVAWLLRRRDDGAEDYWRSTLAGARRLNIPQTSKRADASGPQEVRCYSGLRMDRVRAAASRLGVTVNVLSLAAWSLALGEYAEEDDILFGVVTSGRGAELGQIEDRVGLYVNTLPMRIPLAGGDEVAEWLRGISDRQQALLDHQHTPLSEILRWGGASSGKGLFDVAYAFENYPVQAEIDRMAGLEFTDFDGIDTPHYLLNLLVITGEELWVRCIFDSTRLEAERVENLASRFEAAFRWLLDHPQERLRNWSQWPTVRGDRGLCTAGGEEPSGSAVPDLMSPVREAPTASIGTRDGSVRSVRNRKLSMTETGPCLHELFEAQVERTPTAKAVIGRGCSLDYTQLDREADRLAAQLRQIGVRPDSLVALCLRRSPEMIVGMLGILKAGGAYVPLDPDYPAQRLSFMLRDCAPSLLLYHDQTNELATQIGEELSLVDIGPGAVDDDAVSPVPADRPLSSNLAYVIYTSGSTGRPKGIAMPHSAVANLLAWQRRVEGRGESDRTMLLTSISFDVSVQDIFGALTTGGAIVLPDDEAIGSAEALLDAARANGVTRAFLSTAVFHQLLNQRADQEVGQPAAPGLAILTGGEQLRIDEGVRRFFRAHPESSLRNIYGPTETHVATSCHLVGDPDAWPRLPSIGRPIDNAEVYILDPTMNPVPSGQAGEVYIGGAGLARGYLRRPGLTADRFIADPFGVGGRLYRTGDLGRWEPDGNISFLGRNDHQVKVRGIRVELGEIEARLVEHLAVDQAVVVARGEEPGRQTLVAYYVGSGREIPTPAVLREHLLAKLPEHMAPSAFVRLESIPLTPNGKIDREKLPAPEVSRPERAHHDPPVGELESAVARIWSDVLRVEDVGRGDSFLGIGGDSLKAMQVVARLRQECGLQLRLRELFDRPTLADVATQLKAIDGSGSRGTRDLNAGGRSGYL